VAVEDAIAICNGDSRGAVKALLILNEHLEAELMELQAAMATGGTLWRAGPTSRCIRPSK
jgi:hypothetical protein